MNVVPLEAALLARGIVCRVEQRERLAVIVPQGAVPWLEDPAVRREVLALVREHGFTHLALELVDEPAGNAAVHRD